MSVPYEKNSQDTTSKVKEDVTLPAISPPSNAYLFPSTSEEIEAIYKASLTEDPKAKKEWSDYLNTLRTFACPTTKNNRYAQYNLGVTLAKGRGVTADMKEAAVYLKLSADQGFFMAQYNYAIILLAGDGIPKDPVEAIRYLKLSADQSYADAQYRLGRYYCEIETEYFVEGMRLLKLATKQGHANAALYRSQLLSNIQNSPLGACLDLSTELSLDDEPSSAEADKKGVLDITISNDDKTNNSASEIQSPLLVPTYKQVVSNSKQQVMTVSNDNICNQLKRSCVIL